MFVYNDVLHLYGGYTKTNTQGEKSQGVVHTDMWSMTLNPQLKNLHWEKKKKSPFTPS